MVEIEIALPDEPGFKDVRIRLDAGETIGEEAWERYIRESFVE